MLNEKKIARSYANALFGLALERDLLEDIRKDMQLIEALLRQNPDLVKTLASPVIRSKKKSDILSALLNNRVHELTMRFLHLLVKATRVLYLPEITDQFKTQYKAHHGIVTVHLKSAYPIDPAMRDALSVKLKDDLQTTIELEEVVDRKLVGGFVLQVDDRRYDASVRSKLNHLFKQFDVNIYKKKF